MRGIRPLKDAASCDLFEVLEMYNAMIRYYFKEDPESLSDEDYAMRIREMNWLSGEGFLRNKQL